MMNKHQHVFKSEKPSCPCCGESLSLVAANIDGVTFTLGCINCNPESDWDQVEAQIAAAVAVCSGRD
jgi:hypothetical protein